MIRHCTTFPPVRTTSIRHKPFPQQFRKYRELLWKLLTNNTLREIKSGKVSKFNFWQATHFLNSKSNLSSFGGHVKSNIDGSNSAVPPRNFPALYRIFPAMKENLMNSSIFPRCLYSSLVVFHFMDDLVESQFRLFPRCYLSENFPIPVVRSTREKRIIFSHFNNSLKLLKFFKNLCVSSIYMHTNFHRALIISFEPKPSK